MTVAPVVLSPIRYFVHNLSRRYQSTFRIGPRRTCSIFLIALLITVTRRVIYENQDKFATYAALPSTANRFETPWRLPHRVRLPTLEEARYRVLYSALKEEVGEGLGHHIRTIAADIGTALRLGVAYSHRNPRHGALSQKNPRSVEMLFNLAQGYMPRNFLRDSICLIDDAIRFNKTTCPRCTKLRTANTLGIQHIVTLPRSLTHGWTVDDEFTSSGRRKIDAFLASEEHSRPFTLLEMPSGDCERHIAAQFIGPQTSAYLFQRYWDLHGGSIHARRLGVQSGAGTGGGTNNHYHYRERTVNNNWDSVHNKPKDGGEHINIGFSQNELNVAIHARRGDFFKFGRPRVSILTYGKVLRAVMKVVHHEGGAYAKMLVVVRIYSEGLARKSEMEEQGHDMRRRTTRFQDADGAVLDSDVIYSLLHDIGTFPHGFRIEMKVSADTVRSVHEMVAADVFIGSESTLGSVIVQSLSRGAAILLPVRRGKFEPDTFIWRHALRTHFDGDSGTLLEPMYFAKLWRKFIRFTENSAAHAVRHHRNQGDPSMLRRSQALWPVTRPAITLDDEYDYDFAR